MQRIAGIVDAKSDLAGEFIRSRSQLKDSDYRLLGTLDSRDVPRHANARGLGDADDAAQVCDGAHAAPPGLPANVARFGITIRSAVSLAVSHSLASRLAILANWRDATVE